jgi:hypothetical protein
LLTATIEPGIHHRATGINTRDQNLYVKKVLYFLGVVETTTEPKFKAILWEFKPASSDTMFFSLNTFSVQYINVIFMKVPRYNHYVYKKVERKQKVAEIFYIHPIMIVDYRDAGRL